jgi:hypothetical protein
MKHPVDSGDPVVGNDVSFTTAEDVIQVPVGAVVLAEALERRGDGMFVTDIQDWDRSDEIP